MYIWTNIFQQHAIGDSVFLSLVKQQLKYHFIQNWNGRLEESSRAICFKHISSL